MRPGACTLILALVVLIANPITADAFRLGIITQSGLVSSETYKEYSQIPQTGFLEDSILINARYPKSLVQSQEGNTITIYTVVESEGESVRLIGDDEKHYSAIGFTFKCIVKNSKCAQGSIEQKTVKIAIVKTSVLQEKNLKIRASLTPINFEKSELEIPSKTDLVSTEEKNVSEVSAEIEDTQKKSSKADLIQEKMPGEGSNSLKLPQTMNNLEGFEKKRINISTGVMNLPIVRNNFYIIASLTVLLITMAVSYGLGKIKLKYY